MKKFFTIMILGVLATLYFNSCGPSQKELERQKQIEDSLAKIDSDKSVDEANKYFQQQDSIEQTKQDSIARADKTKKK